MRRMLSTAIILAMVFTLFGSRNFQGNVYALNSTAITDAGQLKPYDDVSGKDLSALDLKDKADLLLTLSFDTGTVWPGRDKLPDNFNPRDIIEDGKYPGLNISKLHSQGYNGNGVNIAYVDQPLLEGHQAYENVNLEYCKIRPEAIGSSASMHGPAVLSLLAGDEIGIAPKAGVYFFGHPAWLMDQRTHAEALYKLIEVNKTLPEDKKIRVVGFSDAPDTRENYIDDYKKAIIEAEKNDIMVIDVTTFDYIPVYIKPDKDRDNYQNYEVAQWARDFEPSRSNGFYVPTSGRTTATGYGNNKDKYEYWTNGGLSWGVPYVAGTIALGLQINPNLTKGQAVRYLYDSGYDFRGGKLINPEGFVNMVKKNCANPRDVSLERDYRYFLYNKSRVSDDDLKSINQYLGKFDDGVENILTDVSRCTCAADIYDMLKDDSAKRNGNLKGIQIFGPSGDVPAFDVHFKIQMKDSVDDSGSFKSDFFYTNFNSDSGMLKNDFSIYKAFNDKLNVSFIPEWPVSRLPLAKGEIAPYMARNSEYAASIGGEQFGNFVNFSNPIFAGSSHSDDFGYFLKERMDKEFNILESSDYSLYGNKQGAYPVNTDVIGDFTRENISMENKEGIKEFIINSHGQWDNIDQCIYTTCDDGSEKRVSFMNKGNINSVLSSSYYDLDLWTCLNAYNLDDTNLVHEAMSNGKCMSAMAASSIISNNGVHNNVSLTDMKKNNFYYFYFNYLYGRAEGSSRSESFHKAQKAYSQEILKNTDMLLDGNYQFNLHNVLSYHYLGLLEYWDYSAKEDLNPVIGNGAGDGIGTANAPYSNIPYNSSSNSSGFRVNSLNAEKVEGGVKFVLDYESGRAMDYSFFNPPDGDVIKKIGSRGIFAGRNLLEFTISDSEYARVMGVDTIAMRFGFDANGSFIDFSTDKLKNLFEDKPEFNRSAGSDRYETCVKISQMGWQQSDYAVIATGDNFPDALCGAPLAKKYDAPILLTDSKVLTPCIGDEIDRLKVKNIIIIGGYGAVSRNIENVLNSRGIHSIRLTGNDRYETSAAIAGCLDGNREAIITIGDSFPDALSISSYAAFKGIPILLTEKSKIPPSVSKYISDSSISRVTVIGGPQVINQSVLDVLPNAERVYGNDRYETNIAILNRLGSEFNLENVYFATGEEFPDALSGSALAARSNSPIIIVNKSISNFTGEYVADNESKFKNKYIIGGKGAVPSYVVNNL